MKKNISIKVDESERINKFIIDPSEFILKVFFCKYSLLDLINLVHFIFSDQQHINPSSSKILLLKVHSSFVDSKGIVIDISVE